MGVQLRRTREVAQRLVESVLLAQQVAEVANEVGQFVVPCAAFVQGLVALECGDRLVALIEHQIARHQHRVQGDQHALIAELLGAGDIRLELGKRRCRLSKPPQVVPRPRGIQALGLGAGQHQKPVHQAFVGCARIIGDVVVVKIEQHREFAGVALGRSAQLRGLLQKGTRLGQAGSFGAAPGSVAQRCNRSGVFAGADQVRCHARRLAAVIGQPARHRRMGVTGDLTRNRCERGLVDEVVCEPAVAQHLGGLQFAPRAGELNRRLAQHLFGQFDTEVRSRHRGHACQREGGRRELREAPFDELLHRLRPSRRAACRERGQPTIGPRLLQGLEHEQRIPASTPQQVRCQIGAAHVGQGQRIDELSDLRFVQRLERHAHRHRHVEQGVVKAAQRRAGLGRSEGEQPSQRAIRAGAAHVHAVDQGLEHLEGRGICKVQVVDHQPLQLGHADQRCLHRTLQHEPLPIDVARSSVAPLGQHARDLVPHCRQHGRGRGCCRALQDRTQQARQCREGHTSIARAGGDAHHVGLGVDKRIEQPCLAQTGLADDGGQAPRLPRFLQRSELGGAPDQARRAQHGHWQRLRHTLRRDMRHQGCDARAQCLGLGLGRDTQLGLEHIAAAIERGQRRGAVATQVVQAHHASVRVLRGRIELDQLLCRRQRLRHLPCTFLPRGDVCKSFDALGAPVLAHAVEPGRKAGGVGRAHAGQQLPGLTLGVEELDVHAVTQTRHGGALEHIESQLLAQAKQALAKIGTCTLLVDIGPQHGGQ